MMTRFSEEAWTLCEQTKNSKTRPYGVRTFGSWVLLVLVWFQDKHAVAWGGATESRERHRVYQNPTDFDN